MPREAEEKEATVPGREYADRELGDRAGAEFDAAYDHEAPDVVLDVPVVKVDEIDLEVDELRARVNLQAEVLDLLRLNVGADVAVGRVSLGIKGVEAQALLKVRLDNVEQIIRRVLETIDDNPQILEQVARGVRGATEEIGGGAGRAVGAIGRGAGEATEDVGRGAGEAVQDVGRGAGEAVQDVGEGAREATEHIGRGTGELGQGVAETARETASGAGKAARDAGESTGRTVRGTREAADKTARGVTRGGTGRGTEKRPRRRVERR